MTTTQLPDKIETGGIYETWRVAKGQLCRGREVDGTLEVHPTGQVLGYLRRIGIQAGIGDDGRPYENLEAELETKTGNTTVKASTASITSSASFARALLDCAKDQVIAIEAKQASKPNKHGTLGTYVNVYHVDPVTWKGAWVKPNEAHRNKELAELLDEIRTHPAYAERKRKEEDSSDIPPEFHAANDAAMKKGWPSIPSAPAAYLALINQAEKSTYLNLGEIPGTVWDKVAASIQKAPKMPKVIADAAANEYDPFADEN